MFTRQYRHAAGDANEDLDREFGEVYQSILSGKGVRTDEEELAIANELIRRAEQGSFPQDGAMHIISPRAGVDWGSDAAMLAVRPSLARNHALAAGGMLIAGAMLFALLSIVGGSQGKGGASVSSAQASARATGTAIAGDALAKTAVSRATQTAVVQATAVWAASGVVVGTDFKQKLPPVYPETLEVGGATFRVYPSAIEAGRWSYQNVDGMVSWIGGTVINWSFGLPALDTNMALFSRLYQAQNAEKEALLRMSGGVVRHFRLQRPVQINRQQIEVFLQNRPGITIVLLGDAQGPKRWLVQGTEEYTLSGYDTRSADEKTVP